MTVLVRLATEPKAGNVALTDDELDLANGHYTEENEQMSDEI